MAFKLTRAEENRRDMLRDKIADAKMIFDEAMEAELKVIEDALGSINAARTTYNETVAEAYGFLDDIINEREGEFDDMSERWQEGDRGEATQSWIESLQEVRDELIDVEEIMIDLPDVTGLPDHAEILDNLQTEPEY